jgi:hypothetical protein
VPLFMGFTFSKELTITTCTLMNQWACRLVQ